MLKLSLIIPVYNEERHIEATLDSIAAQTVKPDEVILVDNNCNDKTLEIAEKYDFVKIVHEEKQGRGHARNAGFNAAKYDVLARIDGDSLLQANWVEAVKNHFETDEELAGLTGLAYTPVLPLLKWPLWTFYARTYYWNVHGVFGTITCWGATMAVSKKAWKAVKNDVCLDDTQVHEDQDIALWIAALDMKIIQANDVRITSYDESFRYFPKLWYYTALRDKTRKYHKEKDNLPPPPSKRIPMIERLGSHVFSIPMFFWGFVVGVIMFPLDYFMYRILGREQWLD